MMSISVCKLRFFALMFRFYELEKERRFKIDLKYKLLVEQYESPPIIITNPNRSKEPIFYEHQGSKFISKPKHNFKKR